jgi:hypothetical protein
LRHPAEAPLVGAESVRRCPVGRILVCLAILLQLACGANAYIWIDEDFEQATAFADLGFAVNNDTTTVTADYIAATQGINVRSGFSTRPAPPALTVTTSGTVVQRMDGCLQPVDHCLRVASGQFVRVGDGAPTFTGADASPMVIQFSLKPEPAAAQPRGTSMGHFRINWSADGDNETAELSHQIDFVYLGGCGDGYVLRDHATGLQMPGGYAGLFQVVSAVVVKPTAAPLQWECYDPIQGKYKGPQPTNPALFPQPQPSDYPLLDEGVHVFVGQEENWYRRSFSSMGATPTVAPTHLLSWEIAAENGATLCLDQISFVGALFSSGKIQGAANQDAAARLDDFHSHCYPVVDCFAAAKDWELFE